MKHAFACGTLIWGKVRIHFILIPSPLPAVFSAGCQQPGSPGWPQQLLAVSIFPALFFRKSENFR